MSSPGKFVRRADKNGVWRLGARKYLFCALLRPSQLFFRRVERPIPLC
jgi:hypothetical protein